MVGEKWTLLILREAFYGVRRFDDFHSALGCARNLLATRLKTLVENGLLERVAYRSTRDEVVTSTGFRTRGVSCSPPWWHSCNGAIGGPRTAPGPPVELFHRDCGEPVTAQLICRAGHAHLGARDIGAVPGPGAISIA